MRIDGWQDIATLISTVHDGYWPSTSPTPAPKMALCASPDGRCTGYAYAFEVGGKHYCRAPLEFSEECERMHEHKRVALTAQRTEPGHFRIPPVNAGLSRSERRRSRLQRWVMLELEHLEADGDGVARILRQDLDMPIAQDELERVCSLIYKHYCDLPVGAR